MARGFAPVHPSAPAAHPSFVTPRAPAAAPRPPVVPAAAPKPTPTPAPIPPPTPRPVIPIAAPSSSPRPAFISGPSRAVPPPRPAEPTATAPLIKPAPATSNPTPRPSITPSPAKPNLPVTQSQPGVANDGRPVASNPVPNQSTTPRTVATPQTSTGVSIPQRPNSFPANSQVPRPGQAPRTLNPGYNKPSQGTTTTPQVQPQAPRAQEGARPSLKPNVNGQLRPNPSKSINKPTGTEENEGKKSTGGRLTAADKSAIESLFARSSQYASLHRTYQNLQSQYSAIHPRNPSLPPSHPLLQKLIPIVTQLRSTATQIDTLRKQLAASGASSTPALKKPAARSYIGSFTGVAAMWAQTLTKDEALQNQTGPTGDPTEGGETMGAGQSKPSWKDNVDWGSVINNGISTAGQVVGQAVQAGQGQGQGQFGGSSTQPGLDGQQQPMVDPTQDPSQQQPGTDMGSGQDMSGRGQDQTISGAQQDQNQGTYGGVAIDHEAANWHPESGDDGTQDQGTAGMDPDQTQDQGQTDAGSYAQGDGTQGFGSGYDDQGIGQGPNGQAGGYGQDQYGQDQSQYAQQGQGQDQYGNSSGY